MNSGSRSCGKRWLTWLVLCAPALLADSFVAGPDGVRVTTPDIKVTAETAIEGGDRERPVRERKPPGGGIEFTSVYADRATGRRTTVVERFRLQQTSVRWEVEIRGDGPPWTKQIITRLRYPASAATRFWTAWSDPTGGNDAPAKKPLTRWTDPLRPMPLAERRLSYGGPAYTYDDPFVGFCPLYGDLLSVPLATLIEPASDRGLSLVLSPEDDMLDMSLAEHADGTIEFARQYHRIAADRVVRFATDLVPHEGDWRGGLRWMRQRYPAYFEPALGIANQVSGTGAYSASEVPFEAAKMRRMAFSVNWKASFDFPYMGMFLPPTNEAWPRYGGDSAGNMPPDKAGSRGMATIESMAEYSATMRKLGFHVLNYFNVTEFGANIKYPPPQRHNTDALWKDPNDFLYGRLRDAILRVPDRTHVPNLQAGAPYFTWGNGVIMDSAEPVYQQFLLDQAKRHIEKIPDSDGICIDRMDWLRMYNEQRDDGITWFNDRPARSLVTSWRKMMDRLLPLMHDANKVVFVNNHDKRLDTLLGIDGIFDEFTYNPAALNLTGFLSVARPASGWTSDESQIRPDPDGFFQRFLYMGVFPMAPFPGNDHSLPPSEWVDRQYLDYGPLMNAMRGRTWVLDPHAIEVRDGAAIANLFRVADGWVGPVVFGGSKTAVTVRLRGIDGPIMMDALHPGSDRPVNVSFRKQGTVYEAEVPLVRGCAMLQIRPQRSPGEVIITPAASIVADPSEPLPLRKAVADLSSDFAKVFGTRPQQQGNGARIAVAVDHSLPAESYRITAKTPNTIALTGGDMRGAIYAIYEFSHRFLGVDPLWFWTDHDPPRRSEIRIPANTDIRSGPPAFRYRGWFINDEDLLTGWKPGKADGTGIALEVWDRIFEALLRLKGNMIVPGTFIFPDEPQVRAAADRGLIITQHHIEVLGTNTYRWPDDQPYSFTSAPQLLINAWRNSATGYRSSREVLWTLGYRGRHDRPFWEDDPSAGTTEQARARVIRQAIDTQMSIVRETRRNPYFIMNAWDEAVPLVRKGYLQIPDGVTLVWPDNGHGVIRDGGTISKGQGVYYHTAMHDFMANQLTEMVPLERIDRELGRAVKAGAIEYLLVNTSDIRPVVMTTRAVMELAWSGRPDPDFLERWSREEFGADAAKPLAEYYRAFLDAPGRFGAGETQTFGDSAYHTLARAILTRVIKDSGAVPVDIPTLLRATTQAEPRWANARRLAESTSHTIPPDRKDFFQSQVLTQLDVHEYSNRMLKNVAEGRFEEAGADLDRVLESFHASEYGKWAGFYSRELFTNVRLTRALIAAALDKRNGEPVPPNLAVQSRTPDPYPFIKAYQGSRRVNTTAGTAHTLYLSSSLTKNYVVGAKLPSSGLFALTPGGWQHRGYNMPFLYGIDGDASTPLLAGGNGLIRAEDDGDKWTILTGSDVTEIRDVAVDRNEPGTIYIAHSHGIRVTHDGGATWREIGSNLHRKFTEAIRVDPRHSKVLVAGGEEGLFRTEDEGVSWKLAGAAGYQILRIEVSPHDPCYWLASTQRGGLFASTDCGRTFESASPFGVGRNIYAIAFDPTKPGRIAVAAWGPGVGVSEDNGKTWQVRNTGLPSSEITAAAFDPDHPGHLYAAVREKGLYVSPDAGANWKKEGFDEAYITFLRFLPEAR